jgi:hypothetical protein
MTTEAEEIQRIVSASVHDMLDAYRLQSQAAPVTDKALGEIIFRASHGVLQSLAPYPREQRLALQPNIVGLLLTAFLENMSQGEAHR